MIRHALGTVKLMAHAPVYLRSVLCKFHVGHTSDMNQVEKFDSTGRTWDDQAALGKRNFLLWAVAPSTRTLLMPQTVAVFGAAGKVGTRITHKLLDAPAYQVLYVERGAAGMARLRERGLTPTTPADAAQHAEMVILAVPDVAIGAVAAELVPQLQPGTLVMTLDPAAPFGGELPARADIAYFVVHPCHPPVINDETDLEAKRDLYGE